MNDALALETARKIEAIFSREHKGGEVQRRAAIQCAVLDAIKTARFQPCPGCDGHECDWIKGVCRYPDASKGLPPSAPQPDRYWDGWNDACDAYASMSGWSAALRELKNRAKAAFSPAVQERPALEAAAQLLDKEAAFARKWLASIDDDMEHDKPNWKSPRFYWKDRAEIAEGLAKQIRALPAQERRAPESEIIERCAQIAENYKRDASFDDSQVGAGEHNANQINIANAIRALSSPPAPAPEGEWREKIGLALREHWLTGIHCDAVNETDAATCYCTVWKSEPMPSVGAAVDAWIAHVLDVLLPAPPIVAEAKGELKPHAYAPSAMHMGDCAVCGHVQSAAIHSFVAEKSTP